MKDVVGETDNGSDDFLLFEEHGAKIDSPYDDLERFPQEQFSESGVEGAASKRPTSSSDVSHRMVHTLDGVFRVYA